MGFNQFRDHMKADSVQWTFFRSLFCFFFLSSVSSPILQYADAVSSGLKVLEARHLKHLQIQSFTKVPPIYPCKPS